MSETGPEGPYVYQPYGHQDKEHWQAGRIYGVGGVSELTTIDGLTKQEAQAIYWVLSNPALVAGGIEELVNLAKDVAQHSLDPGGDEGSIFSRARTLLAKMGISHDR